MVVVGVTTIILASVMFAIIAIMMNRANKRRVKKAGKTIPGPPRLPLLGSIFLLTQKIEDFTDMLTTMFDSYPSIYQIRVGPKMVVIMNDPDLAKIALVDHKLIERSLAEMLMRLPFGTGLITAPEATWRLRRKIIGRTFNSTFLRNFIDVFDTQASIMVQQLEVLQDGPEFDMEHFISPCVFDIMNETAMNVKLGTQMDHDVAYKRNTDSVVEIATTRFFKPWLHPDFLFYRSSVGVRFARCSDALREFTRSVIEKHRGQITHERPGPQVDDHVEHAKTQTTQRKTLLNLLLNWESDGAKLQNEDIIDEINTISMAGTDTTSTTTNMLMLVLACYPDIQKKVYEEVTEVHGNGEDDGRPITVDQLNNLTYLERVIKETLRLFPIATVIPRDVMEDISMGDYHVPKGAIFVILISALHRNEQFWPDPLKFDPDRFLPEAVEKRHPYAYMPFGAGPRKCIGEKYALMLIKMMCAKVVQKYTVEKDNPPNVAETKMRIGIAMQACDPVTVRIRKRRRNFANA